jgi:hypothetical protein
MIITGQSTGPAADRGVYLTLALVIAVVVAVGFGRRLNETLIAPVSPRPWILYVHAVMFAGWVVLFVVQSALVRVRRVALHRRLGLAGILLGSLMPIVGVATALTMTRLHRVESHADHAAFLSVSFFDMLAFAVTFGLAVYWRRRPDCHRRLMFMATAGLTVAAFARFPTWLMPNNLWYLAVDALIVTAVVRDRLVLHRVHSVYRYGLPLVVLGQGIAMWLYLSRPPAWLAVANALLR